MDTSSARETTGHAGETKDRSPRQRWGTCCPYDPGCEHSFLDGDDLARWMDTPLNDAAAKLVADLFDGHSGRGVVTELQRLTQPDWCNAARPGNWQDACQRNPGHDGDHATRKPYRMDETWTWPAHGGYPVRWRSADEFPDLWDPRGDLAIGAQVGQSGRGPDA